MVFYYNDVREGEKIASIRPMKWEEVGTVLSFSEAYVTKNDDKYRLYFVLDKTIKVLHSEGEQKNKPVEPVTGIPLYLDIKRKASTYKGKVTEPSRLENFLASQLDKTEEGKFWKGSIALQDSPMLEMLLSGKDAQNQPLQETFTQMAWATIWNLIETEPSLLKPEDCIAPKGWSKSGWGSSGQTELEKLNDRMEFIKKQLVLVVPSYKVESVFDLTSVGVAQAETEHDQTVLIVIDACSKLMGLPNSLTD